MYFLLSLSRLIMDETILPLFLLIIQLIKSQQQEQQQRVIEEENSSSIIPLSLLMRNRRTSKFAIENYMKRILNRNPRYAVVDKSILILSTYFNRDSQSFREHFRLKLDTFQKLIKFLFEEDKVRGWTIEIEMMTFLFWLACGCCYRVVGATFSMPRSTVCRIVHKYLELFASKITKFVMLPKATELEAIGKGFCALAKNNCFLKAVGAIDGCHVKIARIPEAQKSSYFSGHKGYCSSNFQAVVDHKGLFIDVFIGFPGSAHDSRILRHSPMFFERTYPPKGYYILGDGGYPLLLEPIAIITPFPYQTNLPVEGRFNTLHSKARSIVERAFGRLKARWRSIFLKALECSYLRVPYVIAACICLQNYCINSNDIIEAENDDDDDDDNDVQLVHQDKGDVSGSNLRDLIARVASRPIAPVAGHVGHDHDY